MIIKSEKIALLVTLISLLTNLLDHFYFRSTGSKADNCATNKEKLDEHVTGARIAPLPTVAVGVFIERLRKT